ncbi:hypothetical protein SAZ11_55845 [Streptomyces sp. FXJ1.4098]|nr:hypothetical protein [Streptomyces sp. FXJ1.4098]
MTSTAFSRERRRAQDRSLTPEARGLLLRSTALFDSRDETEILHRAMALVGAVGPGRAEAGYLMVGGALTRHHAAAGADAHPAAALDEQVRELAGRDGPVRLSGRAWGWAYALREPGGLRGQLVVSAGAPPSEDDRFWLTALARQTAAALSGAAAHRRERERAAELRRARVEQQAVRERLESVRAEFEHERGILDTLHRAAVHGDGEAGIAEALHQITGLAAGIEDRFGHPRAWAGPGRPDPYPHPTRPATRRCCGTPPEAGIRYGSGTACSRSPPRGARCWARCSWPTARRGRTPALCSPSGTRPCRWPWSWRISARWRRWS